MAGSRKKQPDLLPGLLADWPQAVSGSLEVGLSGGLDSMVLLDLMWRSRGERHIHLSAVHVNHGLSENDGAWAAHCRTWCERLDVPLRIEAVSVRVGGGESLEAVARAERYAVYRRSLARTVVLAHHQDDQAETVLLQLLRGGGPHALAAMPVLREFEDKLLWRPLLGLSRPDLEAYAQWRGLKWVFDESNDDTALRRNFLRHDIIPLLASAIPDYRSHLERTAALMAQAVDILDEVAAQDLAHCLQQGRLRLPRLAALSSARQRQLLVRWIAQSRLGEASPDAIEEFRLQLHTAGEDRCPLLDLPAGALFRYRDQVWVEHKPLSVLPLTQHIESAAPGVCDVQGGVLTFCDDVRGIDPALLRQGFELRVRQGGERLHQSIGAKAVKTLLQEAGIPPRLRARWPLLYLPDGRLAAVPSIAVATDCCCDAGGYWPLWNPD
jgi:tRNA(Ile)-lysidine synthase